MNASTVAHPPTAGANSFYTGNRAPLLPNPLIKLPIGAIRPEGWLRYQLVLMSEGMIGHLSEISQWCVYEGNAWVSPTGEGANGWEELPYWLKGYGDLGYILKDERITAEAKRWIDGVLASQRADGYFGAEVNRNNRDLWPNMVMLNVLESWYEATGDERVIAFMTNYFRWQNSLPIEDLLPGSWQKVRGGDNLQSVYWLYNRTGGEFLLELAKKIHERTENWTEGIANWHGVNFCQGFKEPGLFYQQSRDPYHLRATERIYQEMMDLYGQVPGAMFGADENCRKGYDDPRQAAETCSIVEFMLSNQHLVSITGDPKYADRCEDAAFNSLPASQTPDLKALHYLTAPNMVQLDEGNKAPGLQNAGCMLAYSPGAMYRCCQHNVSHGWPYFSERLWMATRDNGLAAVFYAASSVEAKVGKGAVVKITVNTDYPFRDTIGLAIALDKPERFPLYLRIPAWCSSPRVHVNDQPVNARMESSSYIAIDRTWKDGDRVVLTLPMEIRLRKWEKNKNSVSVDRGPLTYSLKIGERWSKLRGDRWPDWEVYPTTPWNYGLVLDEQNPASSFRVVQKDAPLPEQPFDLNIPLELRARAKKIPNWQLVEGLVGVLQPSPVRSGEPEEEISLIPMGCARLRIASFPVIGDGPDAREWVKYAGPPFEASHVNDSIHALYDGIVPKKSSDMSVPRFTWWEHKGTTEWITWKFEQPRRVKACEVFWYDDTGTGGCRVPESWRVLAKKGGEWVEMINTTPYEIQTDRFNRVNFEPVETIELRIEVKLQEGYSAGILEWRVRD